jgi:hypothetical protein
VPVCSVRFRLFLAIDINPVPATGIDDPSQKRESCRLSHRESETRTGDRPGHGGLRFDADCRRPDQYDGPIPALVRPSRGGSPRSGAVQSRTDGSAACVTLFVVIRQACRKAGTAAPEVVATNPSLGERVAATPAIADDTLYVRTAGHLYAFAGKE